VRQWGAKIKNGVRLLRRAQIRSEQQSTYRRQVEARRQASGGRAERGGAAINGELSPTCRSAAAPDASSACPSFEKFQGSTNLASNTATVVDQLHLNWRYQCRNLLRS
jgi:hypothetical protein